MNLTRFFFILLSALISSLFLADRLGAAEQRGPRPSEQFFVYIGTYTGAKSKGIYSFQFDAATGKSSTTTPALAAESVSPSSLALHPTGQFLYAANEVSNYGGKSSGSISAYAIRESGRLELLNAQASGGPGPCYLFVDPTGQCVLTAHYNGGSIAALPIAPDGKLREVSALIQHTGSSVNPSRQNKAYAHWIETDPANKFALACDLGLDKVLCYRLDPVQRTLTPNDPPFATVPPGSGPRHLAFHPSGRWAYVINEMGNTISAFSYDTARGALSGIQTIPTLPAGFTNQSSTAEIAVHPSGKFVYGSNRGHDSIAVFAVDGASGKLTLIQHQSTLGKTPRNFALDPTGRWLLAANQGSDNIVVFRVDAATGKLTATEEKVDVGAPSYVVFLRIK